MRTCKCGNNIPYTVIIGNKRRNLRNRTQCLSCLPFGQSPYRQKTEEERRQYNAKKARQWYRRHSLTGRNPINTRKSRNRKLIIDLIGHKCQFCNYSRLITNLAFHHLFDKQATLDARVFTRSLSTILPELRKCVLCCHNCHGEIHNGLIITSDVETKHIELLVALSNLDGLTWPELQK